MTTTNTPVVTLKLYDAKQLPKQIFGLGKSGASWQQESHRVACSIVALFGENNDVRIVMPLIDKLVAAMPEAMRLNSLKLWFEAHAPIKFSTSEEIKAGTPAVQYVKGGKFKLGDAMAKPYWKFKAQEGVAFHAVDLMADIGKLLKRIEAHNKGAEAAGVERIDAGMINALTMMQAGILPSSVNTIQ